MNFYFSQPVSAVDLHLEAPISGFMFINHSSFPESFLHFVWRARYVGIRDALYTIDGRKVEILYPGYWNHDQGPDFLQARLKIDGVLWHGHVEIHVDAHDWYAHKHQLDSGYNGVVLHVVFRTKKKPVFREDETRIPELVLENHIPQHVFRNYDQLIRAEGSLPCASRWEKVPAIVKHTWLTRLAIERLEQKSHAFSERLKALKGDWNQLLWEAIGAGMGGPVNKEAFTLICKKIPVKLLAQYRNDHVKQEALLFGLAGLLGENDLEPDFYHQKLVQEWEHLQRKHDLPIFVIESVRFHRMRPAAFPTIRLSQLASIANIWPQLTALLGDQGVNTFMDSTMAASTYWDTHYRFQKPRAYQVKKMGKLQKASIVINIIAPLGTLFHRLNQRGESDHWLEDSLSALPAEHNKVTRVFESLETKPRNTLESQGMIRLYHAYCSEKRCLDCAIGTSVLGTRHDRKMVVT